jgi:hypothetical protein
VYKPQTHQFTIITRPACRNKKPEIPRSITRWQISFNP